MTWTKIVFIVIAVWFICGCQLSPHQAGEVERIATSISEGAEAAAPFLPGPAGLAASLVALVAASVAGTAKAWSGKIKSYNKGRTDEVTRNGGPSTNTITPG